MRSSAESESVAYEHARAPARLPIDKRQSRISLLTGVLGRRERRMPPAVCLRCEAHAADGATSSLRRRGVQCHCRSAAGVVADQAGAAPARPCALAAAVVVGRDFGDVLGLPRARCGDVIGVPALWPGTRHWLRHAIDFNCLPLGAASRIRGSDVSMRTKVGRCRSLYNPQATFRRPPSHRPQQKCPDPTPPATITTTTSPS